MALFRYKCKNCESKDITLFSHEDQKCPSCGCLELEKLLSVPLKAKALQRVDNYHNVQQIEGIAEDVKKRNREHTNKELAETINQFGQKIAKEQNWIDKKTGKIRTNLDDK